MKIEHMTKHFGGLEILRDFSLTVQPGEIVALIGPSGCGKSTLLNILAGLQTPDSGHIQRDYQRMGYVFQESRLLPWRSVYENIHLARPKGSPQEVRSWIAAVGLAGVENYYPAQLSGGMAKRCAIARAFYFKSDFLLMDEPFQGLDYGIRMEMLQMLLTIWQQERQRILFVTHEIDEALMIASRIAVLSPRPATVLEEIVLPGQEGRDVTDENLQFIRHKIVQYILPKGQGGSYGTEIGY